MAYKNREDALAYYRKYNAKRKESRKQYGREYYELHKEEAQAYYQQNRQNILIKKKQEYKENTEHFRAIGRNTYYATKDTLKYKERRLKNREQTNEYMRQWVKTPVGKRNAAVCNQRRRSRKKSVGGEFTATDIKDLYATQGGRCYYCSIDIEAGYHIDHMLPISRGGTNGPENLALACAPCNLSKHTKTAEEFMTCSV